MTTIHSNQGDPYIQVGVRMRQSQIDELDTWCKKNRLARSVAIRQAIEVLVNGGQAAPLRFGGDDLADRLSRVEATLEVLQQQSRQDVHL